MRSVPSTDVIEIYRHLKSYGVRVNGMRYPLDPFNAGIVAPVQPLPIAVVLRVDGDVRAVRYGEAVAREDRNDQQVIDRVEALLRADAETDHDDQITEVDDVDGYAPYAGGISGTTLMGLQRRLLNVPDDGILRNY